MTASDYVAGSFVVFVCTVLMVLTIACLVLLGYHACRLADEFFNRERNRK